MLEKAGSLALPPAPRKTYNRQMAKAHSKARPAAKPSLGLDDFREPEDEGLSLDQLSEAYAQLLAKGEDPYKAPPAADELSAAPDDFTQTAEPELGNCLDVPESDSPASADPAGLEADPARPLDACPVSPRAILEAMLFVGHPHNEPLSSKQVAALMRGVRADEIDDLVVELNAAYAAERRPYEIVSSGSGYVLCLRPEFAGLREKFFGRVREARLNQAAVDVLAIVAYNQPLTRAEVEKLRGKPSGAVLNQLVRRELLRVERPDPNPNSSRYLTTDRFLDLFGLESLADLPRSQELDRA